MGRFMRLMVILAVLLAALAMGQPRPAQAANAPAMADCHTMPAPDHQQHPEGDQRQLAHSCPGCALPFASALPDRAPTTYRLPKDRPLARPLASLASAPIPPPPRAA
ncbi:hypothetical protein D2V17_05615 [Aurantiacibacter xanthus]|uniref:DUF2946 domain-containing protein n=1 Tax=Aurantiacibacter xanthus TaxID=1784712 RepID=A0A3A1P7K3_9SPHN|nr:DUF2946 family protein [Aurantiacibacter xanthus]RIV89745.1 hypothetical protein D2V17_05615 [Aurantiacibacter xanthus]